jgi:mono/diheme cytochrome c family protein
VTDIPEHLLARSRERRAALGLGGDDAGGATPAPAASAAVAGAGATPAVPAAAAATVPIVVEPPKPVPPYVVAAKARPRVPMFVAPVLAALPVFLFVYWGTLTPKPQPEDPVLALGASVYAANCAACHGTGGGGGVGRPLNEVVKTFPVAADHIAWVSNGGQSLAPGTVYGVDRQAKQGNYASGMPGFAKSLTAEQIAAVVHYERVEFGGESATVEASAAGSGSTTTTTKK